MDYGVPGATFQSSPQAASPQPPHAQFQAFSFSTPPAPSSSLIPAASIDPTAADLRSWVQSPLPPTAAFGPGPPAYHQASPTFANPNPFAASGTPAKVGPPSYGAEHSDSAPLKGQGVGRHQWQQPSTTLEYGSAQPTPGKPYSAGPAMVQTQGQFHYGTYSHLSPQAPPNQWPGSPISRDSSLESLPSWTSHGTDATGFISVNSPAAQAKPDWGGYSLQTGLERGLGLGLQSTPPELSVSSAPSEWDPAGFAVNVQPPTPIFPSHNATHALSPGMPVGMGLDVSMAGMESQDFDPTRMLTSEGPTYCGVPEAYVDSMVSAFPAQRGGSPTPSLSSTRVASSVAASTIDGAEVTSMRSTMAEIQEEESRFLDRRGTNWGLSLEDFDIVRTLGTGTFGKVLLVKVREGNLAGIPAGEHYAMKVLNKVEVVRLKQVEHMNSEKDLLALVSGQGTADSGRPGSNFVVKLFCTFQDERNLYMLLEYVEGGELFTHLRRAGRFTADVARFFAANVVLALEALHARDIVYRDLKPENILIDQTGYVKITDFGFAKKVPDRTYTLCGTPEYLCPEVVSAAGHGKAADWWAFGVLLFEMLCGYPPFFDDSPLKIYEKILECQVAYPKHIDAVAKDLISRLLCIDRTKRLGNLKRGIRDVKKHKWFEGVDWQALAARRLHAPIVPRLTKKGDSSYFERFADVKVEELPGVHRAVMNRQGGHFVPPEVGSDPYGHLFESF